MQYENTVGSFFSGIGGIDLGFEREGFNVRWFIENNEYCQKVLRKNFPGKPIYEDAETTDYTKIEKVRITVGGFPCQDISQAGKGKGITGKRSGLWKAYKKGIGILLPEIVFIENVPMLYKRGLNVVLADLAEMGYDAEWFTLSAQEIGALHVRERLFIIAYSGEFGQIHNELQEQSSKTKQQAQFKDASSITSNINSNEHNECVQKEGRIKQEGKEGRMQEFKRRVVSPLFITNNWKERIQRFKQEEIQGKRGLSWCKDVRRIEDLQGRSDIPEPLFRGSRDGIPNWVDRIAGCGNAVVPQVSQFIARQIKEKLNT